jgi:glycosyltransferase involved in cell wall biosynthesis
MKICLCITNFKNDLAEAISKTGVAFANQLAKTEDCTLMIPGEILVSNQKLPRLKVINYGQEREYGSKIRVIRNIQDIGAYFRQNPPRQDIIHFIAGNLLELFLIRLFVPTFVGCKVVTVWQPYLGLVESLKLWTTFWGNLRAIAHHYLFNSWLHVPFFLAGHGYFDKIIVHTRYQKMQLSFLPTDKVAVIANGIVSPPAHKPRPKNDIIKLLYIGHATGVKGVDVLIEALTMLKGRMQFQATFALSTFENVDIKVRINAVGLEDQIKILGRVDVCAMMNAHDLFVLPHKTSVGTSCYPNIALEAFSAGLPIISSSTEVLSELIEDGETGIHVPPNNPKSLAEAIFKLSKNSAQQAFISNNQKVTFNERYRLQSFVDAHRAVYEALV